MALAFAKDVRDVTAMPFPSAAHRSLRQPLFRLIASFLLVLGAGISPCAAVTFLIEAEDLEIPGAWEQGSVLKSQDIRQFLIAGNHARSAPAVGAIELPHAGRWRLWVRSKDFPADRPGTRKFTVRLGQQKAAVEFGKHGQAEFDGWAWEDGGVLELPAGSTLVAIGDQAAHSARCDALVVTDNMSYRPAGPPWLLHKELAKTAPLKISEASKLSYQPAPLTQIEDATVATLQNESVRLNFHRATTASGAVIAMRPATNDGGRWVHATEDISPESYRVLFRPPESDPRMTRRVHPTWDVAWSPKIEAEAGGATASTRLGVATAPWASGQTFPLRPTGARQVDARTVELTFPAIATGQLRATWRLAEGQSMARVEMHFTPSKPGHFSLGYHAPLAAAPDALDFLLLPFMFQGRRFPARTETLLSALTPTPLALVNRGGVSSAVVAEPGDLAPEWPGATNSRYLFALRNENGQAQPMIYSPVFGQPGSISDGAPLRSRFQLWLARGDWYAAYRRIADETFALKDYRRPVVASLSDAALNLVDLMRNEAAAGWDARAKGPWNIESRNTVTHTSPLTYLSIYLLTGDEDFYHRFARPSLEYLLSRPSPHFAAEREIWDNYYQHQPMRGPARFFGANTFASAYAMTHGRSPAFGGLCLDEKGAVRPTRGSGHVQLFEDQLALFRLTGDKHWLEQAIVGADNYIAANLTNLPTRDLGEMPFINNSFVPDWEGLLHLYEATGEARFLAAAREGARWLVTSFWTQPSIPKGDTTIHPGGVYDAGRHLWWFGDEIYRRGLYQAPYTGENVLLPPTPLPERRVPAWQVSRVGLGLEQPSTYTRNGPHANILMNTWAPALLRLAGPAKDPAFRTAARNATIGRFTNYPGYYLDGATDEYFRPSYPLTGPDVTSLYVHHVPPFTASVIDYLFSDVETRSGGAIAFPWVRECGYVWFDSRLFGHAPGHVYGQSAWPWLHRTAATVDTINVDRLLAHGDGRFHVVLLNQVREPQRVRVSFDEKVLGRDVNGAAIRVHLDNQPAAPLTVKDGAVELMLPALSIAALSMDGVRVDVPTHRVAPPATFSLPTTPALRRSPFPGTGFEAVGTVLEVPPFTWRDFYVSITAGLDDARAARLRYRVGEEPEKIVEATQFPWEFSVRTEDLKQPITWQAELQLPDGRWVTAP